MKQLRYQNVIPGETRLAHAVPLAFLLVACLLTALLQTRSEASIPEDPAVTSSEGVIDVEVGRRGPIEDPLEPEKEPNEDSDSPELRPSSTEVSATPDANGDPLITKIYRLKYGLAVDFGNTLAHMFNMPQEITTSLDGRTNSLVIRTNPQRHEEVERLLKTLDVPIDDDASAESTVENSRNKIPRDRSETETALEKQVQELSRKMKQLAATVDARRAQDPVSDDQEVNQLAKQLKDAVEESFNERQRQQLAEIERLTTRLNRLAKSVQQREAEREQIISRKIDELLGKSSTEKSSTESAPVNWQPSQQPNPGEILKEAMADTAAQRYPLALSKYVWYFENALRYDPAQKGVRLSFALNDWMGLAAHYPPALDALKSRRDVAEQNLKEGANAIRTIMEIAAINRVLNDDERTKTMFEALAESDPTTAKRVFNFVRGSLVKVKAYALCGKFLDPQQDLARLRQMRQMQSQAPGITGLNPVFDMSSISTRSFAQGAGTLVALLVLNDRKAEAEEIAREAKGDLANPDFHLYINNALAGKLPDETMLP